MKIYISKGLNLDDKKTSLIKDFCLFCAQELSISRPCEIYVVDKREDYGISTTAAYDPGNGKIYVYAKRRALVDLLRSIAHEMTHMRQDEQGLIKGPIQDIGGFHEDQANAKAGQIIKLYARDREGGKQIYEKRSRYKN